ncbi:MAG: TniQ family protein [Deltaproteobacteria bacterium]
MIKVVYQRNITILDNLKYWSNTLPNVLKPTKGESLHGFLLRLDAANNFNAGCVLNMVKKHETGQTSFNRPGLFILGSSFDLNLLAKLVNVDYECIVNLTFAPVLTRIFRTEKVYPSLLGYSSSFKICPQCILEKNIPLLFSLSKIKLCPTHNLMLIERCICGNTIQLFSAANLPYYCPICNIPLDYLQSIWVDKKSSIYAKQKYLYNAYSSMIYSNIDLVHKNEELAQGLENRFQSISYKQGIYRKKFSCEFGQEAYKMYNGHGISNLSLTKIVDILHGLNYTPKQFRDIKVPVNSNRIVNDFNEQEVQGNNQGCPNIYCKDFNLNTNVRFLGKKKQYSGEVLIEQYCQTCGTRFIGNNIVQSYDHNPGLRQYDIELARARIEKWQNDLISTCKEMINKRIPITLTGCFKIAGIPIGKAYFTDRLGLITILEEYAEKQREDFKEWQDELQPNESNSFLRRIYKRRKIS